MESEARPLEIGDAISESFRIVGENFGVFAAIALMVLVPNTAIALGMEVALTRVLQDMVVDPNSTDQLLQRIYGLILGYFVVTFVTMALYAFGQACAMYATVEHMVGRKASLGDALRVGLSRFVWLFLASLLVGLIVGVGLLMCGVPGIVAYVWLSVTLPVIAVEQVGPIAGMQRSIELTEGHRWTIFLVFLVLLLAMFGFSVCMMGPASLVSVQGQTPGEMPDPLAPGRLVMQAISLVVQCGMFMIFSAVVSVIYARLRGLRDGVDADALAQVFA